MAIALRRVAFGKCGSATRSTLSMPVNTADQNGDDPAPVGQRFTSCGGTTNSSWMWMSRVFLARGRTALTTIIGASTVRAQ